MRNRPKKNAAGKKNHHRIRIALRSPILAAFRDRHYEGGVLSILADEDLVKLSEVATTAVMITENISICLKRSKQC